MWLRHSGKHHNYSENRNVTWWKISRSFYFFPLLSGWSQVSQDKKSQRVHLLDGHSELHSGWRTHVRLSAAPDRSLLCLVWGKFLDIISPYLIKWAKNPRPGSLVLNTVSVFRWTLLPDLPARAWSQLL